MPSPDTSADKGLLVLRASNPLEWPRLVEIWRSAVEATHHFLTPADVAFYESQMQDTYFPAVSLTVAECDGEVLGFSGLADGMLAMLFVDASAHGQGVGSALLQQALRQEPNLVVDVNEQNPQALGFYQRHGFVVRGRSPLDGDGRPFPLLHLERHHE